MYEYRVYFLNEQGHVDDVPQLITCATDEDALARCATGHQDCSASIEQPLLPCFCEFTYATLSCSHSQLVPHPEFKADAVWATLVLVGNGHFTSSVKMILMLTSAAGLV
jgi:hypothetical protein